MRALPIVALLLVTAEVARADDKANVAAARALLDLELASKFDSVPRTAGIGTFPGELTDGDMQRWWWGPPYIARAKLISSVAGWSGDWGWIAADLSVDQRPYMDSSAGVGTVKPETHRYHLVQVYALDKGKVVVHSTQLIETRPDDKLEHAEPKPGGPPQNGTLLWNLVSPGQLELADDANVAVLGTGPAELGLGAAAAKRLLASWKKLSLSMVGTPKQVVTGTLGVGVSEVDLMLKGKSVRLRGMVVARKTGGGWKVVALSYGSDSDFGDPKIPGRD